MTEERIAALPMYDFPYLTAAHDSLWGALAERLSAAGVAGVPPRLTRNLAVIDTWRHPRLLLGQACEYPLAKSHAAHVRLVATPCYAARGCDGARYRSAIVIQGDDPASSLADLRGRRCAVNQMDSNSGMNLLRAAVAPLAAGEGFFGSVVVTGSHLASARMVGDGRADTAAIDCVSLAHFERFDPALIARLRILAWTEAAPSLPFVTAMSTDAGTLHALHQTLAAVSVDPALGAVRERLFLEGFDLAPDAGFSAVWRLEQQAIASGYPSLQ